MGCKASTHSFVIDDNLEGQSEAAVKLIHELGIPADGIAALYNQFKKMDLDGSGEIQAAEMMLVGLTNCRKRSTLKTAYILVLRNRTYKAEQNYFLPLRR